MSFENLDENDSEQMFSHIGGMESFKASRDYTLITEKEIAEKNVDTVEINDIEVETAEPEMITPEPETKPDLQVRDVIALLYVRSNHQFLLHRIYCSPFYQE